MKKFLSLLLALTLVLSLVVVPARADGEEGLVVSGYEISANPSTVTKGGTVTLNVTGGTVKYNGSVVDPSEVTYSWSYDSTKFTAPSAQNPSQSTLALVANHEGENLQVSCTVTAKYTPQGEDAHEIAASQPATSTTITVNDTILDSDISAVSFKTRNYAYTSNTADVYYDADEATSDLTTTASWGVNASGVTVANVSVTGDGDTKSVTLTLNKTNCEPKNITVRAVKLTAPTITYPSTSATCKTDEKVTFTATATTSTNSKYAWYIYTGDTMPTTPTAVTETGSYDWTSPATTVNKAGDTYKVACKLLEGSNASSPVSIVKTITVTRDTNKLNPKTQTISATPGSTKLLSFTFTDKDSKNIELNNVRWAVTKGSNARLLADESNKDLNKKATLTIPTNASSSYTVTATFNYDSKDYVVTYTVNVSGLSTTLSTSVANGSSLRLYSNYSSGNSSTNLAYIAQSVLQSKVDSGLTVTSATIKNRATTGGTLSTLSSGANPYYTFTAYTGSLNAAEMTIVATAYKSSVSQGTYEIKLTIPVTPIMGIGFESVTAEPVSSTATTTSYRVYFPTTYTHYYVINKTGSTPSSWSNSMLGTAYSSTTPYTLSSSDFNSNGTCTLYVVAKNGISSNYYSGQMVVTQTNYNINYNGVAGETVQFAQSDFTDFMNEVAEARGDASKTKSYPYVTFDYVTFTMPTTQQGTLYYGGTAMSTSNSSGAFNTRTKVTNLDSVTFVPNAKTTAKTITLNFTLHATRYSSSSTSRGTTVSYSGTVVVNLVREDIKYTVSQGDSVRFDESDFLNYLRSTKGYSSNYTIDYVTFDQSAVSAVNEGSLYTYYNGYNYGGSVKTTDKFYYSATASQNALSDVAFLASRYAKTGETVYIPFTIYARYGTTGTGTRQLTGTVAIKIGQTMNFIDVKTTDYFYNSVKWAVGKNITNGTSSTTFSPYKSCTRAEIVTFLWRAAGSPEPTITRNPFRDVNAVTHSSYYKAILWASQKGITSGTSATAFSPDQVCTRAQIVTFLYRYAGQPSGYYSNPFKDVGATSEASYYNAILWAVGKGITTGTSATTFSPYASCNRAEAVTFLYRYTNGL